MAFPTIVSRTASTDATNTTSHVIALPTFANGDLGLILVSFDGDENPSTPAGWTAFADLDTGVGTSKLYYRFCDGTEPASVTITTTTEQMEAYVIQISGAHTSTPPERATL